MFESRLLLQEPGKAPSKLVTARPNEQNTDLEFCWATLFCSTYRSPFGGSVKQHMLDVSRPIWSRELSNQAPSRGGVCSHNNHELSG